MPRISHWRGIVDIADIESQCPELIAKLKTGTYAASDLEQLVNHDVMSLRDNQKNRLLFTTIVTDTGPCILLLHFMTDHRYNRLSFLNKAVLSHFKNKALLFSASAEKELNLDLIPANKENQEKLKAICREPTPANLQALDFVHKFIDSSPTQLQALRIQRPSLFGGLPGSGKSSTGFLAIVDYAMQNLIAVRDKGLPVLYLSQNPHLVKSMAKLWHRHPLSSLTRPEDVQFKTYQNLLKEKGLLKSNSVILGLDPLDPTLFPQENASVSAIQAPNQGMVNFSVWYDKASKHKKRRKIAIDPKPSVQETYEEFRLCSGYSLDEYLKLGKHENTYSEEQRNWFYTLYVDYQNHLKSDQHLDIDLSLSSLHTQGPSYGLVIMDESQNAPRKLLYEAYQLATNGSIIYCTDSHQNCMDTKPSNRPFLLQKLPEWSGRLPGHVELTQTHRCAIKITKAMDFLVGLKLKLLGGTGDQYESTEITTSRTEQGAVLFPSSEELSEVLGPNQLGPDVAIVTRPDLVQIMREKYRTPLVFNVFQIQGLEYKTIITDEMLSEEISDALEKATLLIEQKKPQFRPKEISPNKIYGPSLNQVYVTFTRALDRLILREENSRFTTALQSHLAQGIQNESAFAQVAPTSLQPVESIDIKKQWLEQFEFMMERGLLEQAKAIYVTRLGNTETQFESLIQGIPLATSKQALSESVPLVEPIENAASASPASPVQVDNPLNSLKLAIPLKPLQVKAWLLAPRSFEDKKIDLFQTQHSSASLETVFEHIVSSYKQTDLFLNEIAKLKPLKKQQDWLAACFIALEKLPPKFQVLSRFFIEQLEIDPSWLKKRVKISSIKNLLKIALYGISPTHNAERNLLYWFIKNNIPLFVSFLQNKELNDLFANIPEQVWSQKTEDTAIIANNAPLSLMKASSEGRKLFIKLGEYGINLTPPINISSNPPCGSLAADPQLMNNPCLNFYIVPTLEGWERIKNTLSPIDSAQLSKLSSTLLDVAGAISGSKVMEFRSYNKDHTIAIASIEAEKNITLIQNAINQCSPQRLEAELLAGPYRSFINWEMTAFADKSSLEHKIKIIHQSRLPLWALVVLSDLYDKLASIYYKFDKLKAINASKMASIFINPQILTALYKLKVEDGASSQDIAAVLHDYEMKSLRARIDYNKIIICYNQLFTPQWIKETLPENYNISYRRVDYNDVFMYLQGIYDLGKETLARIVLEYKIEKSKVQASQKNRLTVASERLHFFASIWNSIVKSNIPMFQSNITRSLNELEKQNRASQPQFFPSASIPPQPAAAPSAAIIPALIVFIDLPTVLRMDQSLGQFSKHDLPDLVEAFLSNMQADGLVDLNSTLLFTKMKNLLSFEYISALNTKNIQIFQQAKYSPYPSLPEIVSRYFKDDSQALIIQVKNKVAEKYLWTKATETFLLKESFDLHHWFFTGREFNPANYLPLPPSNSSHPKSILFPTLPIIENLNEPRICCPNCPNPRYLNPKNGKIQPFCSQTCHERFTKHSSLCLGCCQVPRFISDKGRVNTYCSSVCEHKHEALGSATPPHSGPMSLSFLSPRVQSIVPKEEINDKLIEKSTDSEPNGLDITFDEKPIELQQESASASALSFS